MDKASIMVAALRIPAPRYCVDQTAVKNDELMYTKLPKDSRSNLAPVEADVSNQMNGFSMTFQ
jgi:hypothetical protein